MSKPTRKQRAAIFAEQTLELYQKEYDSKYCKFTFHTCGNKEKNFCDSCEDGSNYEYFQDSKTMPDEDELTPYEQTIRALTKLAEKQTDRVEWRFYQNGIIHLQSKFVESVNELHKS